MSDLLSAARQALEALEEIADEVFSPYDNKLGNAILALRQAIEQAQQRKPLTDEEIALIVGECAASAHRHDDFSFARAIERAHGIGGRE